MTEASNLIGQVCECSQGRTGVVTGRNSLPWGLSWVGIGLDNGSLWSSREPKLVRTAERDDLDKALEMACAQSEFASQGSLVSQAADMPDSTVILVLEMVRAGMANQLNQNAGEALAGS